LIRRPAHPGAVSAMPQSPRLWQPSQLSTSAFSPTPTGLGTLRQPPGVSLPIRIPASGGAGFQHSNSSCGADSRGRNPAAAAVQLAPRAQPEPGRTGPLRSPPGPLQQPLQAQCSTSSANTGVLALQLHQQQQQRNQSLPAGSASTPASAPGRLRAPQVPSMRASLPEEHGATEQTPAFLSTRPNQ
jgi:hypothetical protein